MVSLLLTTHPFPCKVTPSLLKLKFPMSSKNRNEQIPTMQIELFNKQKKNTQQKQTHMQH